MLGNRTWDEWIAQYGTSHRNPVNRLLHTVGIPIVIVSILLSPLLFLRPGIWPLVAGMFVFGWTCQFIGHAFEGKAPEFFHDPRFLLVGLRWWIAKVRGRA